MTLLNFFIYNGDKGRLERTPQKKPSNINWTILLILAVIILAVAGMAFLKGVEYSNMW